MRLSQYVVELHGLQTVSDLCIVLQCLQNLQQIEKNKKLEKPVLNRRTEHL